MHLLNKKSFLAGMHLPSGAVSEWYSPALLGSFQTRHVVRIGQS